MKKIVFAFVVLVLSVLSCTTTVDDKDGLLENKSFGDSFNSKDVLTQEVFRASLDKDASLDCVISGMVVSICKNEACDFRITMFDGRDISVKLSGIKLDSFEDFTDQNILLKGKANLEKNQVTFVATGIQIVA